LKEEESASSAAFLVIQVMCEENSTGRGSKQPDDEGCIGKDAPVQGCCNLRDPNKACF